MDACNRRRSKGCIRDLPLDVVSPRLVVISFLTIACSAKALLPPTFSLGIQGLTISRPGIGVSSSAVNLSTDTAAATDEGRIMGEYEYEVQTTVIEHKY